MPEPSVPDRQKISASLAPPFACLICIKSVANLLPCSSGSYLPLAGYFFEMEAIASL